MSIRSFFLYLWTKKVLFEKLLLRLVRFVTIFKNKSVLNFISQETEKNLVSLLRQKFFITLIIKFWL